ncbi:MAG: hypothetical protein M3O30_10210 [Planctomycetota bacterium]|nr:hypothetical protein [Planctomycetota bacterium]
MRNLIPGTFAFIGLAIAGAGADADTVTLQPRDAASPIVFSDVKVSTIDSTKIVFTGLTGNEVTKDVTTLVDVVIDDEPAFNDAQRDLAANRLEKAIGEYEQVISKSDKPWLKTYCMLRVMQAADKTGRFDKAVEQYISLAGRDASAALANQPKTPAPGSNYLEGAARALSAAADAADVKPDQKAALTALLLEVQSAQQATNATAQADARLAAVRISLAEKQFQQAANTIEESKSLFTDTSRQAEALFLLAQAKDGIAGGQNDPVALREAAIAYMRVVADFKNATGAPHVADSLLGAAAILEKLNEPARAMEMYQSIISDFPGTAPADQAKKQVDRLQASLPKE